METIIIALIALAAGVLAGVLVASRGKNALNAELDNDEAAEEEKTEE